MCHTVASNVIGIESVTLESKYNFLMTVTIFPIHFDSNKTTFQLIKKNTINIFKIRNSRGSRLIFSGS